ncbi:MAG TPA: tRNA preQ1(34) S-adenosylmethionine ribosyltransferase-isomerase QueA [Longimicrobiales bacterium]
MSRAPESHRTSAFDYALPPDRIAQHPHQRRDGSRLLVLHRQSGAIEHRIFHDLLERIPAGDALVLNETRVFPARLVGRKPTGAAAEVLLLHPYEAAAPAPPARAPDDRAPGGRTAASGDGPGTLWEALVRPGGKLKPGRVVEIADDLSIEIVDSTPDGGRVVRLRTPLPVDVALERHGRIPLPPYVQREPGPEDRDRYQTVFAREAGSVAAPTAGLHFTRELLAALEAKGVRLVRLVLHIGVGTFRPVEVEDPARHTMHAERYAVAADAAAALNRTRADGGRIWAVGTTVARALETVTDDDGVIRPGAGWTSLFIRPPYRFKAVDRLITNFHLPRSTLLMLVAAFGGYENVMRAYRTALDEGYRFYSYGDAMAIV